MRPKAGESSPASAETVDLREWLAAEEMELVETYGSLTPQQQKALMRFVRTFVAPLAAGGPAVPGVNVRGNVQGQVADDITNEGPISFGNQYNKD